MEQWQKNLQKNLLQKAVNTEFGYNMPVEDMIIKKAKAYPEGTVQMWGNSPYVKTGGKWVLQRKLKAAEEDKKEGGDPYYSKLSDKDLIVEWKDLKESLKSSFNVKPLLPREKDEANKNIKSIEVEIEKRKISKKEPGTKILSTGKLPWEAGHTAGAGFKSNEQIAKEDREAAAKIGREAATGEKEVEPTLSEFLNKKIGIENAIDELPVNIEIWSEKELAKYPITRAYSEYKKKYLAKAQELVKEEKEDESKGKFMQGRPKNPELRNINTGKKI